MESTQAYKVLSARLFRTSVRVLVADDHPDCADSTALFLSLSGFDTRVAHDGENALRITRAWQPHVCVLDLDMPKIDGWELVRRFRQSPWADRVLMIALTGWTTASARTCAQQAGFDYFLRKPAEPERLLRLIQSALHSTLTDNALTK
jgi:CheY-like chemotaxis protein